MTVTRSKEHNALDSVLPLKPKPKMASYTDASE